MPPEAAALWGRDVGGAASPWRASLTRLVLACAALFAVTWPEWREMAHQWWDIDTYAHILLIPPILAWLVWLRRETLAKLAPVAWWPGLAATAAGLGLCAIGRLAGINLIAEAGAVLALQGSVVALLGVRAALVLAFPLFYALFLVPFGDEIVVPLQEVTARIAIALTHVSGVPAELHGLFIDTPAGRFVVAEECSGVKFLIAMIALGTLVAWTSFADCKRRIVFVIAAAVTSILANGVRAWGTIFVAQYVGAERAGGFDHIVYGWVFFAVVIAAVLGVAWRYFEREPADAGLSAGEADAIASRIAPRAIAPDWAMAGIVGAAIAFAALFQLG